MIKKELELFYGVYKDTCLKAVEGSYNKETKTNKVIIAHYVVEYEEMNRRRKLHNKIKELSEIIKPVGECEEIRIGGIEADKKYFVYEQESNAKTEIKVNERKYFIVVPAEMIDEFVELEKGKFQKIYALGTDFDEPTFIEI